VGQARNKVLGAAVFISCLCALQSFTVVLELDRQKVLSGEIWRIWTGHLVHTNLSHLSLNIVAALFVYFAFFSKIRLGELLACAFVFTPLISVALLCIYPEIEWYNGLSGLLHALVAYCSIRMARDGDMVFWLGLGIVWLKVLAEAIGANAGTQNLIGDMTVVVEAHLIGVFIGTIAAIISMMFYITNTSARRVTREAEEGR